MICTQEECIKDPLHIDKERHSLSTSTEYYTFIDKFDILFMLRWILILPISFLVILISQYVTNHQI